MCVGMCGQTAVTHIRSKCNNKVYLLLLCIAYAKCEEADTDHAYLYIYIICMSGAVAAVQILARLSPKSFVFLSFFRLLTHLFVVLFVLIVEICLQRQLGATVDTLEATGMKECEILEWPHAIHLIDGLAAPQACGLVEIWTIHCGARETGDDDAAPGCGN